MIAEIKFKLITTVHERVKPFWQVLNAMATPGICRCDFKNIDLLVAALIFLVATAYVMNARHSKFSQTV
jgi:hypothetical protein